MRSVRFTEPSSSFLVDSVIAPPFSSVVTSFIVVFSIIAVDVPFDSKAIAPPKVAIDGPFHQDPAPVNVELVNENFPEPTISINPPANVNFEPVAVNVDESTLRSLSLLTIAPPLIPYASPKLLISNLVFLIVVVA